MKRYTTFRPIRLTEERATKYDLAVARAQVSFSEWARQALEEKWKRTTGKRRAA